VSESSTGVRVVGIPGPLRGGSSTRLAVERALEGPRTLGAEARLLDLRDCALPFAGCAGDVPRSLTGWLPRSRLVGEHEGRCSSVGRDQGVRVGWVRPVRALPS